jgi:hypothetical protein
MITLPDELHDGQCPAGIGYLPSGARLARLDAVHTQAGSISWRRLAHYASLPRPISQAAAEPARRMCSEFELVSAVGMWEGHLCANPGGCPLHQ